LAELATANGSVRLEPEGRTAAEPRREVLVREDARSWWTSAVHELAHELKTPISAIVAATEIMRDERLGPLANERYRGYVGDIHESAAQMLKLIDRLLARRVLEQAAEGLETVEIDVGGIVRATASTLQPLAEQAGIKLVAKVRPKLPPLIGDPTSIRQILTNLITNALKFTPAGGTVTIDANRDARGRTVIAITDTGQGLDQENLRQALEGVRCHVPAEERHGIGIGLRLVKALSKANGAEFALTSKPGEGTRASITFTAPTLNAPGEKADALR